MKFKEGDLAEKTSGRFSANPSKFSKSSTSEINVQFFDKVDTEIEIHGFKMRLNILEAKKFEPYFTSELETNVNIT